MKACWVSREVVRSNCESGAEKKETGRRCSVVVGERGFCAKAKEIVCLCEGGGWCKKETKFEACAEIPAQKGAQTGQEIIET